MNNLAIGFLMGVLFVTILARLGLVGMSPDRRWIRFYTHRRRSRVVPLGLSERTFGMTHGPELDGCCKGTSFDCGGRCG